MVTDIRTTEGTTFATVSGREQRRLANKYGVAIGPGRYWFKQANWNTFELAAGIAMEANKTRRTGDPITITLNDTSQFRIDDDVVVGENGHYKVKAIQGKTLVLIERPAD